jgi:hypothetical protein
MNPIYTEYYEHEQCACYKIDLPWTKFAKDTRVLCKINEGIEKARLLAAGVIYEHLAEMVREPLGVPRL